MKLVAIGAGAPVRTTTRLRALIAATAAAMLLAACTGGSHTRDQSFWHDWYGDPDTGRPCCGSNH